MAQHAGIASVASASADSCDAYPSLSHHAGQNGVSFSGKGLAIAPLGGWGNLRYSANAAFMMVLAAKHTNDSAVRSASLSWAQTQVDYMMGLKGSAR